MKEIGGSWRRDGKICVADRRLMPNNETALRYSPLSGWDLLDSAKRNLALTEISTSKYMTY